MTIAASLVTGVVLGLWWRYTVLFPTILLVGLALFSLGGLSWATAGQFVLAMTALQVGYLGGVSMRGIGTSQTTTGKFHRTIQRH